MASLTPRHVGNGMAFTLDFTIRMRAFPVSIFSSNYWSNSHCARHNYRREHVQSLSRSFSSRLSFKQRAPPPIRTLSTSSSPPPGLTSKLNRNLELDKSTSANSAAPQSVAGPVRELQNGLSDEPARLDAISDASLSTSNDIVDWSRSFHGLSEAAFAPDVASILLAPISTADVEIKPDGIIYLPEIKYRRILNRAFGPGAWGLAPRSETIVTAKTVTREYALVAYGRLVSIARGEQQYFDSDGIPTATEGCKSNALMRCCKDLGVASELWDPQFIRKWIAGNAKEVWVEHQTTKKRRKIYIRKDDQIRYPYKEVSMSAGGATSARSYA